VADLKFSEKGPNLLLYHFPLPASKHPQIQLGCLEKICILLSCVRVGRHFCDILSQGIVSGVHMAVLCEPFNVTNEANPDGLERKGARLTSAPPWIRQ